MMYSCVPLHVRGMWRPLDLLGFTCGTIIEATRRLKLSNPAGFAVDLLGFVALSASLRSLCALHRFEHGS